MYSFTHTISYEKIYIERVHKIYITIYACICFHCHHYYRHHHHRHHNIIWHMSLISASAIITHAHTRTRTLKHKRNPLPHFTLKVEYKWMKICVAGANMCVFVYVVNFIYVVVKARQMCWCYMCIYMCLSV